MVLAIVLAVVLSVVTTSNFSQIDSDINFVILGSEKLIYKASAILSAQALILDGRMWVNLTEAGRASERAYILGNLSQFTSRHLRMASIAQASPISWTWTTRYITMTALSLPSTGVFGNTFAANLIEVGALFGTLMKQMASVAVCVYGATKYVGPVPATP